MGTMRPMRYGLPTLKATKIITKALCVHKYQLMVIGRGAGCPRELTVSITVLYIIANRKAQILTAFYSLSLSRGLFLPLDVIAGHHGHHVEASGCSWRLLPWRFGLLPRPLHLTAPLLVSNRIEALYHWQLLYIGTKAKCRRQKTVNCKGTLRQVFIRV